MASSEKAPDIDPHLWEQQKEFIRELYIGKNVTLQELVCEMKEGHGFDATKAQYGRKLAKWGFKKNRKKREWIEIAEKVHDRMRKGKQSEVVIGDQVVPYKKLKKEMQRYGCNPRNRLSERREHRGYIRGNNTGPSSVAIVRSPTLNCAIPRTGSASTPTSRLDFPIPWTPSSQVGIERPLSPLAAEASSFLRIQRPSPDIGLHASLKQLLTTSSPLNKSLQAAMIPSKYSKLMGSSRSNEVQLSTESRIMSTAIFWFRNSLGEASFGVNRQMFTWFRANYDPRVFKFLADKKDPSASAALEKLFRQAVLEGESDMVRQLLSTGIDPNQRWRVYYPRRRTYTESKSALLIACERHHLRIAELLVDAGASISESTDQVHAPLCVLLNDYTPFYVLLGYEPLSLALLKKIMDATPTRTLRAYKGCLTSAVRREDLGLIELLIDTRVGDYDMWKFGFFRQHCLSNCSKRTKRRFCGTHTLPFPALKTMVVARARRTRYPASFPSEPRDYATFISELFDSLLCQHDAQATRFLLDAGHCSSKTQLLLLCHVPDLHFIFQILPEAIRSFHYGLETTTKEKFILNAAKIISEESKPVPQPSDGHMNAGEKLRFLSSNGIIAHRIAGALEELPLGIGLQCCQALVNNSLWRSLEAQELLDYKEAFEIISRVHKSSVDSSQVLLLIAAKNHDADELHRLLDENPKCSPTAIVDLLHETIAWGDAGIATRLINEFKWNQTMDTNEMPDEEEEEEELKDWTSVLDKAIQHGNLAGVKALRSVLPHVDPLWREALRYGIRALQPEIVEYLLEAGVNPNVELCAKGVEDTPLSEAIVCERPEMLKLLLRFGANPNDSSALHEASLYPLPYLRFLLEDCSKDFVVRGGVSALVQAISEHDLDAINLLLEYEVDCNLFVSDGDSRKTCLAVAIETEDSEILKLIIAAGANVNGIVEHDLGGKVPSGRQRAFPRAYSALVKAILVSDIDEDNVLSDIGPVDVLLEAGAEVNSNVVTSSYLEFTPLQAAAEIGNLDLVHKLLEKEANANDAPNPYGGFTALQMTASKGLIGIAALLLERGADVNAKGARKGGRTALEAAAENDRIDMVRFLFGSGAHILGPNGHQFQRAKDLAKSNGHLAVCGVLDNLYEEQVSGQSSVQAVLSGDINAGLSNIVPGFSDLSERLFGVASIEDLGEAKVGHIGPDDSGAWLPPSFRVFSF